MNPHSPHYRPSTAMPSFSRYASDYVGQPFYEETFVSPTSTPSPDQPSFYYANSRRSDARSHYRSTSYCHEAPPRRAPTASPRYTSDGHYATADVSGHHSRKHTSTLPPRMFSSRRHSHVYIREPVTPDESDADEVIETSDGVFVLRAERASRHRSFIHSPKTQGNKHRDGYHADTDRRAQNSYYPRDSAYYKPTSQRYAADDYDRDFRRPDPYAHRSPRAEQWYREPSRSKSMREPPRSPPPRSTRSGRRTTYNDDIEIEEVIEVEEVEEETPQPSAERKSRRRNKPREKDETPHRAATLEDARRHKIPVGYSLKNWDPNENPILLLGSVFDAKSLGKWVYDWTCYTHGPSSSFAEMAGSLWLLLIQFASKHRRAEEVHGMVRDREKRELIEDFIESGDRLMQKLRDLLKACEEPMLRAGKAKGGSTLDSNAGVEFVHSLLGEGSQLAQTEKFIDNLDLYIFRFDANCEEIIANPTA